MHKRTPCFGQSVTDFHLSLRISYLHIWHALILVDSLVGIVFREIGRHATSLSPSFAVKLTASAASEVTAVELSLATKFLMDSSWVESNNGGGLPLFM